MRIKSVPKCIGNRKSFIVPPSLWRKQKSVVFFFSFFFLMSLKSIVGKVYNTVGVGWGLGVGGWGVGVVGLVGASV